MTLYNYADYLTTLIQSIRNQEDKNFEVIFVNDGSTDNTREILNNFNDEFEIIHQDNQGKSKAAYNGIVKAHGDYILLLDADDTLLPCAIQVFRDAIVNNKSNDVIFSNHGSKSPESEEIKYSINPPLTNDNYENFMRFLINKDFSFATGSYVFKKEIVQSCFYSFKLDIAEDIPFESCLLANYNCLLINDITVIINKHEDSRRHNWKAFLRQHKILVDEVFDGNKLDSKFMKLKSKYEFRVKKSLFKTLYRHKQYGKAYDLIKSYGLRPFLDFGVFIKFIQCFFLRK